MKLTRFESDKTLETVYELRISQHELSQLHSRDPSILAGKNLSIPEALNRLYAASIVIQNAKKDEMPYVVDDLLNSEENITP